MFMKNNIVVILQISLYHQSKSFFIVINVLISLLLSNQYPQHNILLFMVL